MFFLLKPTNIDRGCEDNEIPIFNNLTQLKIAAQALGMNVSRKNKFCGET